VRARRGCACGGADAGCTFGPLRLCLRAPRALQDGWGWGFTGLARGAALWQLGELRGGRSKRGGKRVRKALEESGGKSAAAARFPVGHFADKAATTPGGSHAGATPPARRPGRDGVFPPKNKKKSNRQLAAASRERFRAGFAGVFADVDPTLDVRVQVRRAPAARSPRGVAAWVFCSCMWLHVVVAIEVHLSLPSDRCL
jgi:hypothetical protein